MHCVNVWLRVRISDQAAQVAELLKKAAELSREEPGCIRFEVYQSQSDPAKILLCEHWESQEAHQVHRTAEAYTTIYQPQVLPLVDREAHVCDLVSG